jgi:hypothetical protein
MLPALPVDGYDMSAVEVENNLYALGGRNNKGILHTVQKLSLDSLTWELLQLKLLQTGRSLPCFKSDTQVYLIIKRTLYSFTPLQIRSIKSLHKVLRCHSSYYSRGTLFYTKRKDGRIDSLTLEI